VFEVAWAALARKNGQTIWLSFLRTTDGVFVRVTPGDRKGFVWNTSTNSWDETGFPLGTEFLTAVENKL
jgi:hypothetical protein